MGSGTASDPHAPHFGAIGSLNTLIKRSSGSNLEFILLEKNWD